MSTEPLLLGGDAVDQLCSVELGLTAARLSASAGDVTTGRVQVADEVTWMRVLAGIVPGLDVIGYKEFHRVGQRVRYHVNLFRRSTGDMLGIVDGRRITSLRTASTAALAFEHLDDGVPSALGVIGSGEEAREGLRAVAAVSTLTEVAVFSPTPANREEFCREMEPIVGAPVRPVASAEAALAGARRAYIATSAAGPPSIAHRDIAHLELVAGIGSTRPDQRELVGDVFTGAAAVVLDCADARHEPGDVIEAVEAYGFDASRAVLLRDWLAAPPDRAGLTVFKSIGTVEQDITLAHQLLEAARSAGAGAAIAEIGSLRLMRPSPPADPPRKEPS